MTVRLVRLACAHLLIFSVFSGSASCAPSYSPSTSAAAAALKGSPSSGDDLTTVLRILRTGLSDLQHEVRNSDAQLSKLEGQLQSQEAVLEHFKTEITEDLESQKDFVQASNINIEGKIETLDQIVKNLETVIKGIATDLRGLKTQANDSVVAIGQHKQKISELEVMLQAQNQHMQNLEGALHNIMELIQAKDASRNVITNPSMATLSQSDLKTYIVQPGDSLEKIAKAQHITVQGLREANPQISGDKIIVGQTLKLPD